MPNSFSETAQRKIRSFVIRSGRMTESQRAAYNKNISLWGIEYDKKIKNFELLFGNKNKLNLEIGFGMGDSLASMAESTPDENFIGIEVHQAGVGRLLNLIEKKSLTNIRVYCHDAVEVLKYEIKNHQLSRVNIYFPDPWHKKRHHKRRLIQHDFLTLLYSKLIKNGILHIATDWEPYAEHVLETVNSHPFIKNIAGTKTFVDPEEYGRPETKFERRGIKLGHNVRDMVFFTQ